ncbi:hypothetical protein PVT71_13565 [Salipiger sp. H15]|uniref:Uncharacterized protein n=1 Tax=Alloyangia sp. H15 TaxID=3029062 RepID=A0AAU8AFH7_9RHOB
MNIYWNPIVPAMNDFRRITSLHRQGDVLTVNGEALDFAQLGAGAALPAEAIEGGLFFGMIERDEAGVLSLTLNLPHAARPDFFPEPVLDAPEGAIDVPPFALPQDQAEGAQ